jgi:Flp pilus assembly pilin Flp
MMGKPASSTGRQLCRKATPIASVKAIRHDSQGGGEMSMLSNLYQLVGTLVARAQREEGQTMAEYAILVTVIAVVVLAAATLLGSSISSIFSSLSKHI